MTDTNVIKLAQPGTFTDSLTEILRNGARALLTQAVETEVADFLGRHADLKTEAGLVATVRPLIALISQSANVRGRSRLVATIRDCSHLPRIAP